MQAIAPTPAFHRATGVFIHDHHLVVAHDILRVAIVKTVSLEQLGGDMDALATFLCLSLHVLFLCKPLLRA